MRTAIITDSNCGLTAAEAADLGIYMVPMPVVIDDVVYLEGIDLTLNDLVAAMRGGRNVSSSQPSPSDVLAVWQRALDDGNKELVYIPMSSGLSSSCSTAKLLADDYPGKVYVADTHRISVTQMHCVLDALSMKENGLSASGICYRLEETAYDSLVYLGVPELKYLKRGGRITPAAAAMGSLLQLNPLLEISGGKLDAYAKVRGTRACEEKEVEALKAYVNKLAEKNIAFRIATAGSFSDPESARRWQGLVAEAFPDHDVPYYPLSCSIVCHTGPDCFGCGVSRIVER